MYDKSKIDEEALREAQALKKQGINKNYNYNRIRQKDDYNRVKFDQLFRAK
jgi:hypothetical protein